VRKLYWAVTLGVPSRLAGLIKVPLKRVAGGKGEGAEKVIPIMDESEKDLGTKSSHIYSNQCLTL